jgi:PAP2 superfamily protein
MAAHEWFAVVYFAWLSAAALVRTPLDRALVVLGASACGVAGIVGSAALGGDARRWWPIVTILIGYWACGRTFIRPMPRIEAWLERVDDRVLRQTGALEAIGRGPRALLEYLEAVYFGCFLLVPGGLLALIALGSADRTNAYWTAIVIAELGAFGVMPLIQTRPPWAIEPPGPVAARRLVMTRVARQLVDRATIRVNTFPSGHAAASIAAALAVSDSSAVAGAVFLAIAASIVVASVAGRYHFLPDAASGVGLGVVAWSISRVLVVR